MIIKYAPYINNMISAFVSGNLIINFTDHPAVTPGTPIKARYWVDKIDTTETPVELTSVNPNENMVIYNLGGEPGKYYFIQIAYEGSDTWSSSFASLCVDNPEILLNCNNQIITISYQGGEYDRLQEAFITTPHEKSEQLFPNNEGVIEWTPNYFTNGGMKIVFNGVSANSLKTEKEETITITLKNIEEIPTLNFDDGYIEFSQEIIDCYRTKDGIVWEPLGNITKDLTITQGEKYAYGKIGTPQSSSFNFIRSDFEDMFISDKDHVLKIRFNPGVSTFKDNILESKTDTIGGKFPFIFRNGQVKYKTLSISGLLSYFSDTQNSFMEGFDEISLNSNSVDKFYYERNFKLRVLEWLNNGKPKLFRSPTEGNYIIQLQGVSLSPYNGTERQVHTFSASAYEVAEYNYNNLKKYQLIRG